MKGYLFFLFFWTLLVVQCLARPTKTYNAPDYGVVGDGSTDDTTAMQKLLFLDCAGCYKEVVIPVGYTVKTFPLNLTSHTALKVDGSLIAADSVKDWPIVPPDDIYGTSEDTAINKYQSYVTATNAEDIRITGRGTIDGRGPHWWDMFRSKPRDKLLSLGGRPNLIQTLNVTGFELDTVTLRDSPFWTVHPVMSKDIYIHHLKILAPMYAPNVDGIDPDSCQNVLIEYNDVACGDDHIAIKAGLCGSVKERSPTNHCMEDDWKRRAPAYLTRNVTVRHNIFRTGMGIAIGSESSGSIQDVYIYNNSIGVCEAGHEDELKSCGWGPALHLKTTVSRSGEISNIYYDNNTIYNTSAFIFVETNYQVNKQDMPPDYPITQVKGIYFRNNRALAHAKGATFHCDKADPCHEIYVSNNTIMQAVEKKENPWNCAYIDSYHVQDNNPPGLEDCMKKSMNPSEKDVSAWRRLFQKPVWEWED